MKYILTILAVSIAATAYAADVDTSRYQYQQDIIVGDTVVPKVVQASLPDFEGGNTILLSEHGEAVYHTVTRNTETTTNIPVRIKNYSSESVVFRQQDVHYFDTQENIHSVELTVSGGPINALVTSLGPNSVRPESISVAVLSGDNKEYLLENVPFSRVVPLGSIEGINTNTIEMVVEYKTEQLFALRDIQITSDISQTSTYSLKFFSDPNQKYTLFSQPHMGAATASTQARPLNTDEQTPSAQVANPVLNPAFNPDFDGDEINDDQDLCPRQADPANIDIDNNGRGDACEDSDQDGIIAFDDNCPLEFNPNQKDIDADGIGDLCDDTENRTTETMRYIEHALFLLSAFVLVWLFYRTTRKRR